MYASPTLTHRAAELHQRDLRDQSEHDRLVAQARSTTRPSSRKRPSMQVLNAVPSLVPSHRRFPRAARLAAAIVALVAKVLKPDAMDAKVLSHGR